MSKKPAPADDNETQDAPKAKRSTLKLALFALVPLVLAGGSYAGWIFLMAPHAGAAHASAEEGAHGEAQGHHATDEDPIRTEALSPEIRAESTVTQTFALSVLIADTCGAPAVPALQAAAEAEALADGAIVNLSWMAAVRRTRGLTQKSCSYLYGEVEDAEAKLTKVAAPAKGGHGEEAGGHGDEEAGGHETPAH